MEPTRPGARDAKSHSFFQARYPAPPTPAVAEAPPPRPRFVREPLAWLAAHVREIALVGVGVFAALGFVLIARVIRPPARPLSSGDVTRLVEKVLKEKKPDPSFAALAYERVRPSLVLVKNLVPDPAGGEPELAGIGTGVVIEDETGMILTALHVVRGGGAVRVIFHDGWETDATVVSAQPANDLAVLKPDVMPDDLIPATLAGSGHLNPGDDVVAVGHPFSFANSVSVGVVSALGRSFRAPQTGETLSNLIQFDAAVNPGNSGGPLLDRNGEVVGIVSALHNPTDEAFFVGIGFAVTIETAAAALGLPPW